METTKTNKGSNDTKAIGTAAKELNLPTHVLRFWETQFPEFIHPTIGSGNRRYYSGRDINILQQIKHFLYDEGYSIRGLRKKFTDENLLQQLQHTEINSKYQILQHLEDVEQQLEQLENWIKELN